MPIKRQQIVEALETLLNTTSGLEGKVYRWRLEDFEERDLPAASFADVDGETEELTIGYLQHRIEVDVMITACGSGSDDTIRSLASNMLTAISADPTLGGLARHIEQGGFSMVGQLANKEVVSGNQKLLLTYQTAKYSL